MPNVTAYTILVFNTAALRWEIYTDEKGGPFLTGSCGLAGGTAARLRAASVAAYGEAGADRYHVAPVELPTL